MSNNFGDEIREIYRTLRTQGEKAALSSLYEEYVNQFMEISFLASGIKKAKVELATIEEDASELLHRARLWLISPPSVT